MFAGLRSDIDSKFDAFRSEFDAKLDKVGALRGEFHALRDEFDAKFETMRKDQALGLESLRTEIANFRADMEKRMHSMTRQFNVVLLPSSWALSASSSSSCRR